VKGEMYFKKASVKVELQTQGFAGEPSLPAGWCSRHPSATLLQPVLQPLFF
jgi:hypothetical protein